MTLERARPRPSGKATETPSFAFLHRKKTSRFRKRIARHAQPEAQPGGHPALHAKAVTSGEIMDNRSRLRD
jgi:hypothetical protein